MTHEHVSDSVERTEQLAADLAKSLPPGSVVTLDGPLGAGKTHFTRGLVAGLGGDANHVSSPTYTLLQIYDTPAGGVFHLDAYRLAGPDDLLDLGFADIQAEAALIVIEWPSIVADALPPNAVRVALAYVNERQRRLCIDAPT